MNIINLNSIYNITDYQKEYIYYLLSFNSYVIKEKMKLSINDFALYTVNKSYMKALQNNEEYKPRSVKEKDDEIKEHFELKNILKEFRWPTYFPHPEEIGYYKENGPNNKPEVYICPEIIIENTFNNNEADVIFAYIVIYFLAFHHINTLDFKIENEFDEWFQAANANMISYWVFKDAYEQRRFRFPVMTLPLTHKNTDFAHTYIKEKIEKQDHKFRLGIILFNLDNYEVFTWVNQIKNIKSKHTQKGDFMKFIQNELFRDLRFINLYEVKQQLQKVIIEYL